MNGAGVGLEDVLRKRVLSDGLCNDVVGSEVVLSEKNKGGAQKVMLLVEKPKSTVVMRIEKAKVDGLYQAGEGQLKRCDYVIITEVKDEKYLIFIEMKKKAARSGKKDVVKQFKGAECLVDYIGSVLWRFYGRDKDELGGYERRFVVLCQIPVPKTASRGGEAGGVVNDVPERARVLVVGDAVGVGTLI